MLVRVEAPHHGQHIPVDLVALLDVSSTMNTEVGSGITRLNLLKKAMKFVIKHLHEQDRLAIVPFNEKFHTNDDSIEFCGMSGQREVAQSKVDKLVANDEAMLRPALKTAMKVNLIGIN